MQMQGTCICFVGRTSELRSFAKGLEGPDGMGEKQLGGIVDSCFANVASVIGCVVLSDVDAHSAPASLRQAVVEGCDGCGVCCRVHHCILHCRTRRGLALRSGAADERSRWHGCGSISPGNAFALMP